MHGRPRPPKGFQPSAEQIEKLEKKTKLLKAATGEVLERVKDRNYDEKTMKMSGKLLMLNPEIYTAWNYRKDAMTQFLSSIPIDQHKAIIDQERILIAEALRSNPKSYGAWHHRRWLVENGFTSLEEELTFVEGKLQEDIRNFHAWNYRLYLTQKFHRSADEELKFSSKMIDQNFSNYSAWNHRRIWLTKKHSERGKTSNQTAENLSVEELKSECRFVHSAFVTDPDDSSAWVYYRRLIAVIRKLPAEQAMGLMNEEIEFFEKELLPLGMELKWMLLTYACLLEVTNEMKNVQSDAVKEICSKLMSIDPMREGFYRDVVNGKTSISLGIEEN